MTGETWASLTAQGNPSPGFGNIKGQEKMKKTNAKDEANQEEQKLTDRIVIRLDRRFPGEAAILETYQEIPRARRQELTRDAIAAGFRGLRKSGII